MESNWRFALWDLGWSNSKFDLAARSPVPAGAHWLRVPSQPQTVYAWIQPLADEPWGDQSVFSVAPNTWAEFAVANGRPDN